MEVTYADGWKDLHRRCEIRKRMTVDVLKREHGEILQKTTSMMDIGPGEGDFIRTAIQQLMPNLTRFHGVEPDGSLCDELKRNLTTIPDRQIIEVEVSNSTIENFTQGPDQPVDLILMSHVTYYIKEDTRALIERLMKWLTPEGKIMIICNVGGTPMCMILKTSFNVGYMNEDKLAIAPILDEMKVKYTKIDEDLTVDFSPKGFEYVMRVFLQRVATVEETEKYNCEIEPYCRWDGDVRYIDTEVQFIVIHNSI